MHKHFSKVYRLIYNTPDICMLQLWLIMRRWLIYCYFLLSMGFILIDLYDSNKKTTKIRRTLLHEIICGTHISYIFYRSGPGETNNKNIRRILCCFVFIDWWVIILVLKGLGRINSSFFFVFNFYFFFLSDFNFYGHFYAITSRLSIRKGFDVKKSTICMDAYVTSPTLWIQKRDRRNNSTDICLTISI